MPDHRLLSETVGEAVRCPVCEGHLEQGVLRLRGELWRQLTLWGMSWMVARFRPDTPGIRGDNATIVLPWQNAAATICRRCRMVIVATGSTEHVRSRLAVVGQFAITVGLFCAAIAAVSTVVLSSLPPHPDDPAALRYLFPIQFILGLITVFGGVGVRRCREWGRRFMLFVISSWILFLCLVTVLMLGEAAGSMLHGASVRVVVVFGFFFLAAMGLSFYAYVSVLIAPMRFLASEEAKKACV